MQEESNSGYTGLEWKYSPNKGFTVTNDQLEQLCNKTLLPLFHNSVEKKNAEGNALSQESCTEDGAQFQEEFLSHLPPELLDAARIVGSTTRIQVVEATEIKRGWCNKVFRVELNIDVETPTQKQDAAGTPEARERSPTTEKQEKATESASTFVSSWPFTLGARLTDINSWGLDKLRNEICTMQYIRHAVPQIPIPDVFTWGVSPGVEIDPAEDWCFMLMQWMPGQVLTAKLWNHSLTTTGSNEEKNTENNIKPREETENGTERPSFDVVLADPDLTPGALRKRQALVEDMVRMLGLLRQLKSPPAPVSEKGGPVDTASPLNSQAEEQQRQQQWCGRITSYDHNTHQATVGPNYQMAVDFPQFAGPWASPFEKVYQSAQYQVAKLNKFAKDFPEISKGRLDLLLPFAEPVLRYCNSEVVKSDHAQCTVNAIHGDFAGRNLLVDPETGKITAVLDWEWFEFGASKNELRELGLNDLPSDLKHRVLRQGHLQSNTDPLFLQPSLEVAQRCRVAVRAMELLFPFMLGWHFDSLLRQQQQDSLSPAAAGPPTEEEDENLEAKRKPRVMDCDVEGTVKHSVEQLSLWLGDDLKDVEKKDASPFVDDLLDRHYKMMTQDP